jgi:hypothetical protein
MLDLKGGGGELKLEMEMTPEKEQVDPSYRRIFESPTSLFFNGRFKSRLGNS